MYATVLDGDRSISLAIFVSSILPPNKYKIHAASKKCMAQLRRNIRVKRQYIMAKEQGNVLGYRKLRKTKRLIYEALLRRIWLCFSVMTRESKKIMCPFRGGRQHRRKDRQQGRERRRRRWGKRRKCCRRRWRRQKWRQKRQQKSGRWWNCKKS